MLSFDPLSHPYPSRRSLVYAARGHEIRIVGDRTYGRGQAIFRTSDGTLCGATEPRADGCVLGC